MATYYSEHGQSRNDFLLFVLNEARLYNAEQEAVFNNTRICVYPKSCIQDLHDKIEMQQTLNQMKGHN